MTWFEDDLVRRYTYGEADIKIEGILGKLLSKNCIFNLIFLHLFLRTD